MPQTSPNDSSLSCRLINAEGPLAREIENKLTQQDIYHFTESKSANYIIWFNPDEASGLHDLKSYRDSSQDTLSKILVIYTLDLVGDNNKNTSIQSNILSDYALQQGIDIRFVCTQGEWGSQLDSSPSSILPFIAAQLKQDRLIYIEESVIFPFDTKVAVEKIFRFWFDRGHRGKTIVLQGDAIHASGVIDRLIQTYPRLADHRHSQTWKGRNPPENAELIAIPGNSEQYSTFLETCISIPKPIPTPSLPPERRPTPEPIIAPIPRFQAVVVEERPVLNAVPPAVIPRQIQSPPSTHPKYPKQHKQQLPYILLGFGIVFIVALLPYGLALGHLWQADRTTAETPTLTIHAAQASLNQSASTIATIRDITRGLPPFSWFETQLSSRIVQSRATLLKAEAGQLIAQGIKYMVTATEGSPYDVFQQAKHVLDDLYLLQSTKGNPSTSDRQWVNEARQMIEIFPQLIPSNKKIVVMVLLQNNLELRPSGGFIGAVALLTFDHGKLLTYDTRDIYDLDSNLKGVVTPPPELRTYLGETSWYFRDANWSINTVESANMANWFLEKEWGSKADVVVGLNLNTLKYVLAAAPALTLPDGQMVSAENLLASAFNHQDVPSAKPTANKQEFISLFIKPLIDQLATSPSSQTLKMTDAFGIGLETGELTIMATDPNVQAVLSDNGWSGNPVQVACAVNLREPCSKDTLLVNETNVGINKANFYLSRKIDHRITLTDLAALHTHTISYSNTSPNEAWPAGIYKSFTRIMLPTGATQITLSLDNKTLTESDYTIVPTQNATLVSVFLEVKPQVSAQLTLSYQTALDQNYQSYVFMMQKQAGTSADPFNLAITPPPNKDILPKSSTLRSDNTYTGSFDRNITFALGQ